MSIEITPYFALDERYPGLIGVRADGDEHETAYVRKAELMDARRENAKLRELCAGLLTGYECGNGELCKGCSWNGLEGDCVARTKARELGVEVK